MNTPVVAAHVGDFDLASAKVAFIPPVRAYCRNLRIVAVLLSTRSSAALLGVDGRFSAVAIENVSIVATWIDISRRCLLDSLGKRTDFHVV